MAKKQVGPKEVNKTTISIEFTDNNKPPQFFSLDTDRGDSWDYDDAVLKVIQGESLCIYPMRGVHKVVVTEPEVAKGE